MAKAKCCIICGAVTVVVIVVMVLVGIFAIAPAVVQGILDGTEVNLVNLTQQACSQVVNGTTNIALYNAATLKVGGPISTTAHVPTYTQRVYTTACGSGIDMKGGYDCGENATEYEIGYYNSPEMTLKTGMNDVNFSVTMYSNATVALNAWTLGFVLNPVHKGRLILKASDVTVKAMGLTFKGRTMRNEMTCTAVCTMDCPQKPIPNDVCYPEDPKHQQDASAAYHMVCEAGHHDITGTTTTTQKIVAAIASTIGMTIV